MNPTLRVYPWIRDKEALYLTRIESVEVSPAQQPGQESVTFELAVQRTLWGEPGSARRRAQFQRPVSRTSQLKFPDPVWGRVNAQVGSLVFLVTPDVVQEVARVTYADSVSGPDDPALLSVGRIAAFEKSQPARADRGQNYLEWLHGGDTTLQLFAGEALAKDDPAAWTPAQADEVARAFANGFASKSEPYVRVSLGEWMTLVMSRLTPNGEITVLNALVLGAEDANENVRRFAVDWLVLHGDPAKLAKPGIRKSRKAAGQLSAAQASDVPPGERPRVERLIHALSD
jgi:hypothetical protein